MAHAQEKLVIIGASGHGRVVLDCARCAGWLPVGFVDRALEPGERIHGVPVLAREPEDCPELRAPDVAWFVAIGENRVREELSARLAALTQRPSASVVHPSSTVSTTAVFGGGVFLGPGAILMTDVRVADGVIVNTAATIDHDGDLGAFAQISPGCRLAGNVTVAARAFLGTGAVVIPGCTIGRDAVVGAGAVVVEDVPPGATVMGNPARRKA